MVLYVFDIHNNNAIKQKERLDLCASLTKYLEIGKAHMSRNISFSASSKGFILIHQDKNSIVITIMYNFGYDKTIESVIKIIRDNLQIIGVIINEIPVIEESVDNSLSDAFKCPYDRCVMSGEFNKKNNVII